MDPQLQRNSSMSNAQERRQAQRRVVNLKVNHRDPRTKKLVFDFAKDLSEGGLFIFTKRQRVVGDSIEVEFEAGDGRRHGVVRAVCRVARATPDGVAAEFINMDEDSAQLLNYFLSR